MLSSKFRSVTLAGYFCKRDHLSARDLLQPQYIHVNVRKLRQFPPLDNPFCGGGVKVHLDVDVRAEVLNERVHAERFCGSLHNSVEFRFCRRLCYQCLRLLQVFMQCAPSISVPPEVLLRDLRCPAWSLSVYTSRVGEGNCWSKCRDNRGQLLRYLPSLCNRLRPPVVGLGISRHISFVANLISGRSKAR